MPTFKIRPMLSSLAVNIPEGPGWRVERKYDGWRALIEISEGRTRIFSRQMRDMTHQFAHLRDLHRTIPLACVLDCELVGYRSPDRDDRRYLWNPGNLAQPVFFDALLVAGYDFRPRELRLRLDVLSTLLNGTDLARPDVLRYGQTMPAHWEGVVAKRLDSPYRAGRTRNWLKILNQDRQ
jgi:bifunctional non-homologous end joining protein LigD